MRPIFYVFIAFFLHACAQKPVSFEKASFKDIGGVEIFSENNFADRFGKNCHLLAKRHKNQYETLFGTAEKWQNICSKAVKSSDFADFIESHFQVYEVLSQKESLFTGYYAPYMAGSITKTAVYNVPLHQKPTDIFKLYLKDLGVKGFDKPFVVRVDSQSKTVQPYFERKNISQSDAKPLLWLKSEIDAFFLQIQGSGFVKLENGDVFHASYAGSNGHAYRAIGRDLIQRGYLKKEEVSMESIRRVLKNNPQVMSDILNLNPRYIFFRKGDGQVRGSLNVPLKQEKSLAVDPEYIPLGLPVFVKTQRSFDQKAINTWMFAEDTGAAIQGGLRGDIYFGQGEIAGQYAGSQNATGKMYVIVPK